MLISVPKLLALFFNAYAYLCWYNLPTPNITLVLVSLILLLLSLYLVINVLYNYAWSYIILLYTVMLPSIPYEPL